MKEIQITKYESNDGKVFNDKDDCLNWEKCLLVDKHEVKLYVNEFLSKVKNYEDWVWKHLIERENFIQCFDLHLGSNRGGVFDLILGYPCEGGFNELDEDFCIDWDKWHKFEDEVKEKFNCTISTNTYYWPK